VTGEPEKTWAVVAGVEKYAGGWEWNLNGPVNDACRFVRWLRDRGVPAGQIKLLLSPLDHNLTQADELELDPKVGVAWELATANALHDALEEIHSEEGDLLYLFLGGHGVIVEGERLFLSSDARGDGLHNLDFDDLLKSLRTDHFNGFRRQVVLVDSCADYVLRTDLEFTPPKRVLSKGRPSSPDQFVLYAAADGERAGNDPIERTGHFSRVVLDWFEKSGDWQWPPDPNQLAGHVKDHFNRNQPKHGAQTPIVIRWRSGKGDEDDLHGSMEEFTGRLRLIREVRQKLDPLSVGWEQWFEFYVQTKRYLDRQLPQTKSRDEMLRHLAAAPAFDQERREFPKPLFEFVWRAARGLSNQPLQRWVEKKITNKTELENLKWRVAQETDSPVYHLMIELAISASEDRPFAKEFGWGLWCGLQRRILDKGVCGTEGAPGDVNAKLSELIKRLRSEHPNDRFHLEFSVSREHLSMEFDHWEYRKSLLGRNFPVSVRSGDGASAAYVGKIRRSNGPPAIQWLPHEGYKVEHISPHFSHAEQCCAIFGFSAPIPGDEKVRELLETLLDCGAPFMLWPREPVRKKPFVKAFDETVAAGSLDRFPTGVHKYRNRKIASPMTLYWDDPARSLPGKFDPA